MLRATDIKRALKEKFPQATFRVHKHGYGWRLWVARGDEEMQAIQERFQYVVDHPDEFVLWKPISAAAGEIQVIRAEVGAQP